MKNRILENCNWLEREMFFVSSFSLSDIVRLRETSFIFCCFFFGLITCVNLVYFKFSMSQFYFTFFSTLYLSACVKMLLIFCFCSFFLFLNMFSRKHYTITIKCYGWLFHVIVYLQQQNTHFEWRMNVVNGRAQQ